MTTIRSMPVLEVRDVEASHRFYQQLGFATLGIWDPGDVVTTIVQRGDVTLMLHKAQTPAVNKIFAAYIYVDNADELHAEFSTANNSCTGDIRDTFYGCREFEVTDPDGHRIVFGKDDQPEPCGPGLGSERGGG